MDNKQNKSQPLIAFVKKWAKALRRNFCARNPDLRQVEKS